MRITKTRELVSFSVYYYQALYQSTKQAALADAPRSEVVGQIAPIVTQAQEYAQENNIQRSGQAKELSPHAAQNPVDVALAQFLNIILPAAA